MSFKKLKLLLRSPRNDCITSRKMKKLIFENGEFSRDFFVLTKTLFFSLLKTIILSF